VHDAWINDHMATFAATAELAEPTVVLGTRTLYDYKNDRIEVNLADLDSSKIPNKSFLFWDESKGVFFTRKLTSKEEAAEKYSPYYVILHELVHYAHAAKQPAIYVEALKPSSGARLLDAVKVETVGFYRTHYNNVVALRGKVTSVGALEEPNLEEHVTATGIGSEYTNKLSEWTFLIADQRPLRFPYIDFEGLVITPETLAGMLGHCYTSKEVAASALAGYKTKHPSSFATWVKDTYDVD